MASYNGETPTEFSMSSLLTHTVDRFGRSLCVVEADD